MSSSSGIAGRTDYSEWDRKASELEETHEEAEKVEKDEASAALGLSGKYPRSQAEAEERTKLSKARKAKKTLDKYKKREDAVMQTLTSVLPPVGDGAVRRITRADLDAGKRVLTVADTDGESLDASKIILTSDLSLLECAVPTNTKAKAYPEDAENDVSSANLSSSTSAVHGLIKVFLSHLTNVTVFVKCKILSATLEVSHCSNIKIVLEKTCTISTVQVDLCKDLTLEFRDALSGRAGMTAGGGQRLPRSSSSSVLWGQDPNDRVFHAGSQNVKILVFRDGFIEAETMVDYVKDGAVTVGNAQPEEMQFVVSMSNQDDEPCLVNERVVRHGTENKSSRAMTQRELDEEKKRREEAVNSMMETSSIKIVDKDGNEVQKKEETVGDASTDDDGEEAEKTGDGDDEVEEIYTNKDEIDLILKECESKKALGNEAFSAGEYAQAVLLYSLALDKAVELPDKNDSKQLLFPRHVVYANRSAAFLKLGQHEKALEDAERAEAIDSTYIKGTFRRGLALHAMGRYTEAVPVLGRALRMEPKNKQIKSALQFAEVRASQEYRKRMAQQ